MHFGSRKAAPELVPGSGCGNTEKMNKLTNTYN
jgi:hypothetical protein